MSSTEPEAKPKRSMSRTQKILFFATGWLIVLMPFLFWWNTWFGRHLSDQQLTEYLHDDKKPRHIQHALVQMGERMGAPDRTHSEKSASNADVQRWYPDLVRLANDPVEEVRNTDAWVMGLDHLGRRFSRSIAEDAGRSVAHGSRKRRVVTRALRRRYRASTNRGIVATGTNQRSDGWTRRRCRPARNSGSSGRIAGKISDHKFLDRLRFALQSRDAFDPFRNRARTSLPEQRWRSSTREPSRYGKRCEHCIWSGNWKICRRFVPTNATCPIFPMTYASKRWRRNKRFGSARERTNLAWHNDWATLLWSFVITMKPFPSTRGRSGSS